jgi:hypothetical protein
MMTVNSKLMKSYLLIFDAQDITKGPIQRLELPSFISYGLHGNFVPNLTFNFDEVKRKFTVSFKLLFEIQV